MEKLDEYKPGGTVKGKHCLASSTKGWPEEEMVLQQDAKHRIL